MPIPDYCSKICIYISFFTCFLCVKVIFTEKNVSYRAAVYEHVSVSRPWLRTPTKAEAADHMNLNLDIFEEQVKAAAVQRVQIIVFPEDGVYGFLQTRDTLLPYLETVPSPYLGRHNPCDQPDQFNPVDYPVLRRLSCMAKNYSITIVANMGTVYNCSGGWSSENGNCYYSDLPSDGRFQHNTDVAFGDDGTLLATYDKINLYGDETEVFDSGYLGNYGIFNSSFGTVFGLLTCFDMLFALPTFELILFRVNNFIFPTAWMNQLPLLSAVEYQQSWSKSFNVNLLASNQHLPLVKMTGSGIYASGQALVYHYDMTSYNGKLLIADVPSNQFSDLESQDHFQYILQSQRKLVQGVVASYDLGFLSNSLNHRKEMSKQNVGRNPPKQQHNVDRNTSHTGKPFVSTMNDDPYTFVTLPLGESKGQASVCFNSTCCYLNYSKSGSEGILPELYALGVYNGMHTKQEYYVQTCALVKCGEPFFRSSCGEEVETAHTRFNKIFLSGNFTDDQSLGPYFFPEMLTTGSELAPQSEWSSDAPFHTITSEQGLSKPLLTAAIFGRIYNWD